MGVADPELSDQGHVHARHLTDRDSNEYVPIEELKAAGDPRWQALLRGEWTSHEESPEQFAERVVTGVERRIANHRGERVAIVCHGGVINTYFAHVPAHLRGTGLPIGLFQR